MDHLWLIRHGETEWSLSGAHTGSTDIPLTEAGRQQAAALGAYLARHSFSLVLSSPLSRALDTARIAGYQPQVDPDVCEWDYGAYEGRKTADIRQERPNWSLWRDGVPAGESIGDVAARARRVIAKAQQSPGDVALFAHGHFLRILTSCWLELPASDARLFALGTASISTLGHERETQVILRWNLQPNA
jgi:broad specificity phosphatase PhoE